MRAILAGLLLSVVGTGCCETCSWCRRDGEPARAGSGYVAGQPGVGNTGVQVTETPGSTGGAPGTTTGMPTAPTGPAAPAGRPVGAYGGTGN